MNKLCIYWAFENLSDRFKPKNHSRDKVNLKQEHDGA